MRVYEINFSCHTSIYQLACMHTSSHSFSSTSSRRSMLEWHSWPAFR